MLKFENNIAMMQGRLSPIKGGRIQSFPWQYWKSEIVALKKLNLSKIEWTLDLWRFYKNPIIRDPQGVLKILKLHDVMITSVTSDAHMHGNFWSEKNFKVRKSRLNKLTLGLLRGMKHCSVKYLVVPLVDESSLVSTEALNNVISYFISIEEHLVNNEVTVLFETDFQPSKLSKFIENFSRKNFGINYDIGNSAALGYDPDEEFAKYGEYIKNVHVKDRPLGGVSCLLGTGDAKFDRVVKNLKKINYGGDFVMQTARSKKGQHYNILKDQLEFWQSQWGN